MRTALLIPPALALTAALIPNIAEARKPDIKRKGGQAELMVGASFCVPGKAKCKLEGDGAPGTLTGKTAPMIGVGLNAGYRFHRNFFLGAGYSAGFFNPDYEIEGGKAFSLAAQQTVVAVPRFILPAWRFDFGLEAAPGFSRVVFKPKAGSGLDKQYTQGFALRPALSIDFFIARQVFLGLRAETIFNFHGKVCRETATEVVCQKKTSTDNAAVHQAILGLHVGGTF